MKYGNLVENLVGEDKRRIYGEHLTSIQVFERCILPEVKDKLYSYLWADLFCGEGNLILPILNLIPPEKRESFFLKHIILFDIQEEMVEKAVKNACSYGIPEDIARQRIMIRDTIKDYPAFILNSEFPVFHITNPPYLYKGYIAKQKSNKRLLEYFSGDFEPYQDLYQLAMMNDLKHGIKKMIYIIPSNFLFGSAISNKIREDFLKFYTIKRAYIFERKIFEHTGTNVCICFFERKPEPRKESITFEGIKINSEVKRKIYVLETKNHFRAGNDFDEFVSKYKSNKPFKFSFYLTMDEVEKNKGTNAVSVIDVSVFDGKEYERKTLYVNDKLYERIKSNILFVRTLDTGKQEGRAGLYVIKDVYGVDGILVSKEKYRTHPIQLFFSPSIPVDVQLLLKDYFNMVLEYFRALTDSEFMTTYKYSDSEYTRKYLGLSQVKAIIETFPYERDKLKELAESVKNKNAEELISFIKDIHSKGKLLL
jgi:type I restriction-modification system DNA methylase subunit